MFHERENRKTLIAGFRRSVVYLDPDEILSGTAVPIILLQIN